MSPSSWRAAWLLTTPSLLALALTLTTLSGVSTPGARSLASGSEARLRAAPPRPGDPGERLRTSDSGRLALSLLEEEEPRQRLLAARDAGDAPPALRALGAGVRVQPSRRGARRSAALPRAPPRAS